MIKFIMRLDDACEKRNVEKWDRVEVLFDEYNIKPLVGIIPHCEDPQMEKYRIDENFWGRVNGWEKKGWIMALHGYNHVYSTECGGINPVNRRSEFAGQSLEVQKYKIRLGVSIMKEHGIEPKVFFAPSHTFDLNTIKALREESEIYIISDTIASNVYTKYGMTFVPQQSGRVRKLPFQVVTFCYHPNTMSDKDFQVLETFLLKHRKKFVKFPMNQVKRSRSIVDRILSWIYFVKRRG